MQRYYEDNDKEMQLVGCKESECLAECKDKKGQQKKAALLTFQ